MTATPEAAYEAAIGHRNRAWARWQTLRAGWVAAGEPKGETLVAVNDAARIYDWAARELVRARVIWRREVPGDRAHAA